MAASRTRDTIATARCELRCVASLIFVRLVEAGDVELNPGPRDKRDPLSEEDLRRLFQSVRRVSAKWRDVGEALEFSHDRLKAIAKDKSLSTDEHYMQELLNKWLKWDCPLPCVEDLATALRSVEEESTAYDLMLMMESTPSKSQYLLRNNQGFGMVSQLLGTAESYLAQIFISVTPVPNQWKIYCVVTNSLQTILSAAEEFLRKCKQSALKEFTCFIVKFEQDEIELKAFEETTENGWHIETPYPPVISMKEVRNYEGIGQPPMCELYVRRTGDNMDRLPIVKLFLRGTKPPRNYFVLDFSGHLSRTHEPSVSSDPSGVTKPEASPSITSSQPETMSGASEKTTASPPSTDTTSTSESTAIVENALKEGFKMVKCLVQGPASVGKTHVKALVLKKKMPLEGGEDKSPSTNTIEKAVRAICTEKFTEDDESWKEVSAEDLMKMLTKEIKHQHESPSLPPTKNVKLKLSPENSEVAADGSTSEQKSMEIEADSDVKIVEELISLVANCEGVEMEQKWLYFVDSGGQPQFNNVFQAFIQNTSILLLVINLVEKLSACNEHRFQNYEGQNLSNFEGASAPKVVNVLKSIASTLHYKGSSSEENTIFIVGAHKDKCEENPIAFEAIEEKQEILCDLIDEERIQAITRYDAKPRVIFPVNGLQAKKGEFDGPIVDDIREKIFGCFGKVESKAIPLRWFALELALEQKATSVGQKVLTFKQCMSVAKALQINDVSQVKVALEFLQDCSLLLFYPDLYLVFTDPQALLDIYSAIVAKFISGSFTGSKAEVEKYKKAILSYGAFNELLDISPGLKDVLTCDTLLKIFQNLLIATKVDEDKYFIPALLPMQDIHNIQAEALSAKSSLVPLVFLFSDKCTPSGFFCAVVVKLLSSNNWEVDTEAKAYSNVVTLFRKKCKPRLAVTFIDSFKSFEVHCSKEDKLPEIRIEMETVIESVIDIRKYKCEAPKLAFLCSCTKCQFATLEENGDICCDCHSYTLEETKRERKWLQAQQEQASAYTTPAVAAPLETRRTQEPTRTELKENNHLEKLLDMTEKKAAPHWRAIGRALGFKIADLEAITHEKAHHSDKDYYSSMMKKWLNWAPPNHKDVATLEALIAAMRAIDELERLAHDLEITFA